MRESKTVKVRVSYQFRSQKCQDCDVKSPWTQDQTTEHTKSEIKFNILPAAENSA